MEMDIAELLSASEQYSTQRLTLYIPNKDKDGEDVENVERWVKEARELLSRIGRGATAYPPADGTWMNPGGAIVWEQTKIIYTYIIPDRFQKEAANLREFLHRFGREANQGEVVVEFDGDFIRITEFEQDESE